MDRGAWWAAVHGVAEGRTRLSNFTFHFTSKVMVEKKKQFINFIAVKICFSFLIFYFLYPII